MSETSEAAAVTVRYFAAARAAAGVTTETVALPPEPSITTLTEKLADTRPQLAAVLARCSFLVDEVAVRDRFQTLSDGSTVDVLPPFAGG